MPTIKIIIKKPIFYKQSQAKPFSTKKELFSGGEMVIITVLTDSHLKINKIYQMATILTRASYGMSKKISCKAREMKSNPRFKRESIKMM